MAADDLDWMLQELRLQVRLRDIDGDAFETLFQDIGKALWGNGFQATIPMGQRGDLKCDGWRADFGYVYQCYGPRYGQADVNNALKKVDEDFRGAKDHWKELLKKWWFVIGLYRDKVPSEILRLMAQLSSELGVPSGVIHRDDIVDLARDIEANQRAKMFGGRAPTRGDMVRRTTYENIGRALAFIRADITRSPLESIPLPTATDAKVAHNLLPDSVRQFFEIGVAGARRVENISRLRPIPVRVHAWPQDLLHAIACYAMKVPNLPKHTSSCSSLLAVLTVIPTARPPHLPS